MLVGLIVWPNRSGYGEVKDVALSLQADRTIYRVGQRVVLTLTVTNTGERPLRLMFPSAQVYDFVVRQDGREVWRWSRDKMFAMVLTEVLLLPGTSQSYSQPWDQVDTDGKPVLPGAYEVVGLLAGRQPDHSQSLRINIR